MTACPGCTRHAVVCGCPVHDPDDVGTLLRHADFRTTQRVYVHTKLIDVRKRMEACAAR